MSTLIVAQTAPKRHGFQMLYLGILEMHHSAKSPTCPKHGVAHTELRNHSDLSECTGSSVYGRDGNTIQ